MPKSNTSSVDWYKVFGANYDELLHQEGRRVENLKRQGYIVKRDRRHRPDEPISPLERKLRTIAFECLKARPDDLYGIRAFYAYAQKAAALYDPKTIKRKEFQTKAFGTFSAVANRVLGLVICFAKPLRG
jgi:hypothetical protein